MNSLLSITISPRLPPSYHGKISFRKPVLIITCCSTLCKLNLRLMLKGKQMHTLLSCRLLSTTVSR